MGTRVIVIHDDGRVQRLVGAQSALSSATEGFRGETSVVTLRSPFGPERDNPHAVPLVGVVHERGRLMGAPVNLKAWLLYGRSSIHGPMFVSYDGGSDDLPDDWIDRLSADDVIPAEVLAAMNQRLASGDH